MITPEQASNIKQSVNRVVKDLKELKAFFGTIEDAERLYILEKSRIDWTQVPPIYQNTVDFFKWGIHAGLFKYVVSKNGVPFDNYRSFNMAGYSAVLAFLQMVVELQKNQLRESLAQNEFFSLKWQIWLLANGRTSIEKMQAEILHQYPNLDFFSDSEFEKNRVESYREEVRRLDVCAAYLEQHPGQSDFETIEAYLTECLGECPVERLMPDETANKVEFYRALKSN